MLCQIELRTHNDSPIFSAVRALSGPEARAFCPCRVGLSTLNLSVSQERLELRPARFELAAYGFEVQCSIQLSYGRLPSK